MFRKWSNNVILREYTYFPLKMVSIVQGLSKSAWGEKKILYQPEVIALEKVPNSKIPLYLYCKKPI